MRERVCVCGCCILLPTLGGHVGENERERESASARARERETRKREKKREIEKYIFVRV